MDTPTLKTFIHTVPDFPKPGVRFRDITPLLAAPEAFKAVIAQMVERLSGCPVDAIAAIEARGFIFGAAMAAQMCVPFYPVRKAGKLPRRSARVEYDLEYGQDALEIHVEGDATGLHFAIVDDVLATGGTARAVVSLLESCGAKISCCSFLMELEGLAGRERLREYRIERLLSYSLIE